jgi:proteasome-associated ATPase
VVDSLRVGQRVILNAKTMAIQQVVDDLERIGTQANVSEWLDDKTVLVEDSRGDKRVVLAGDGLTAASLEPGTDVLLDESIIIQPLNKASQMASLGLGSRFLLAEMPDVTFDDIGGLDVELKRVVAALENPHLVPEGFEALRRKPTFSAIFLGLPGNGKTMIAKAIARRQFDLHREKILKHAKGNFFAVGGTELYEKWLGNTERYLREIIGAAQRLYQLTGAISTVFFDDCESFFLTRSAGLSTNINGSVVTQFSTLIEGVRKLEGVSIIAATNRLDLMDLAVVRRFGRQVRIKPPDTPERASAVLAKHLRDVPFRGITSEEATRQLVGDIFASTSDNELMEVFFKKADDGDDSEVIRLCDLISGKFLCDVVDNAKDLVIEREAAKTESDERVWALTYPDLRTSLETELRSKESLPMSEATISDWLMQKGDKREVDYIVNLREKRKGEARRNRIVNEKVV